MTEASDNAAQYEGSILANERENFGHQSRMKAIQSLRTQPGHGDTTAEDLEYIESEFPTLRDIQRTNVDYQRSLDSLSDNVELDRQEREDRYMESLESAQKAHEDAGRKFVQAVKAEREQITRSLFGIGGAKDAAAYRSAIMSFKGAPPQQLREAMEMADYVGDKDTERAIAAVADMRGEKDIVLPHLARRGTAYSESYTRRSMLPTDRGAESLVRSFKPKEAFSGQIQPNPAAKARHADEQRRAGIRRSASFR